MEKRKRKEDDGEGGGEGGEKLRQVLLGPGGGGGSGGRRLLAGRIHIDQHLNSGRIAPQLRNLLRTTYSLHPQTHSPPSALRQRPRGSAVRSQNESELAMPSPNATSDTDGRKKEREQPGHSSQSASRPWFTPHAMHARLECYPYARYALISSSQTPPPNSSVPSYRAVVLCLASKQHRVVPKSRFDGVSTTYARPDAANSPCPSHPPDSETRMRDGGRDRGMAGGRWVWWAPDPTR